MTNTVIDAWLDLWNGDLARAQECVAPDFRLHAAMMDGSDSSALRGPDGLLGWITQIRAAFSELTYSVQVGPITQGELTAVRWNCRGTYGGGFPGSAAAPGTRVDFDGTDILRVVDGRIAEYWVNSDIHVMLAQLLVKG